jgi:hypothetical protein
MPEAYGIFLRLRLVLAKATSSGGYRLGGYAEIL